MESIIKTAMIKFLNMHNFISSHQHGFLRGHSTGFQILECLNQWTKAIDVGDCIDVCYIDFSRAFDTVSIPKLLLKLHGYGFKSELFNWLNAFFSDRKLCVKVNSVFSDCITQTSGIAQGSCLGPLAFLLYINDLPQQLQFSNCSLFADDVKVYYCFKANECTDPFQIDLNAIATWAKVWQLTISVTKTILLHIGNKNPKNSYIINGQKVTYKDCVRDLGVYVSSDLSWRSHCVEMCRKANGVAHAILHMFKTNNINIYMKAFDAYVRPIVEYCSYVWNPSLKCDIDMVENVQKSFTRRAFYKCDLNRTSYLGRLQFLKRSTLEYRRITMSLSIFYQIFHNFVSCNVLHNFNPPHVQLRGHSKQIFIPFCKTSVRKNFFTIRMLPLWNGLPSSVVDSNVTNAFLRRLDECDFTKFLRFNDDFLCL